MHMNVLAVRNNTISKASVSDVCLGCIGHGQDTSCGSVHCAWHQVSMALGPKTMVRKPNSVMKDMRDGSKQQTH